MEGRAFVRTGRVVDFSAAKWTLTCPEGWLEVTDAIGGRASHLPVLRVPLRMGKWESAGVLRGRWWRENVNVFLGKRGDYTLNRSQPGSLQDQTLPAETFYSEKPLSSKRPPEEVKR